MSLTRGRHKVGSGYYGPIPSGVWLVIRRAYEGGISASSNFAREQSTDLALAASLGWVSTISLDGLTYGRVWNATVEGIVALQANFNPQELTQC